MSKESLIADLETQAEEYETMAEKLRNMADELKGASKAFGKSSHKASNGSEEKPERWGRGKLLEAVKDYFVKNGNAPSGVNEIRKDLGAAYPSVYNIITDQNADQFEETKDGYRLTRQALKEAKENQAVVLK